LANKIIHLPEIGEVHLQKKSRAKRLSIRLKPMQAVQVTVPQRVSFDEAEKMVLSKIDWIKKHLPKMQKIAEQVTIFSTEKPYLTKFHQLYLLESQQADFQVLRKQNIVQLYYPQNLKSDDEQVQTAAKQVLQKIWRKEAQDYLPQRTAELAQKHNFKYKIVKILNARTRWGSCSADNVISLNLHLIRLPQALLDYVILHELCHTIEKNHAPAFWSLLDKVSGDAKGLDKQLNQYRIEVF
jgi:predicted metal-dependent hydrolase